MGKLPAMAYGCRILAKTDLRAETNSRLASPRGLERFILAPALSAGHFPLSQYDKIKAPLPRAVHSRMTDERHLRYGSERAADNNPRAAQRTKNEQRQLFGQASLQCAFLRLI